MSNRHVEPWRTYSGNPYLGGRQRVDELSERVFASQAAGGSRALLTSTEAAFLKFGSRYGISVDEARHLLLNTGVKVRSHG